MSLDRDHPGFEDLSAFHDGEAAKWTDHVAGCATCRARLAQIAGLSGRVAATPADDTGASDRSHADAVSRAVAAATPGKRTQSEPPTAAGVAGSGTPTREEPRRWWLNVAVAAVLVLSAGAGALVANRADHPPTPTAVGSGSFADSPEGAASRAVEPVIVAGDLGGISDRGALVARVRADIDAARAPAQGQDRAALSPEASPDASGPPAVPSDKGVPQTTLTGPQPCEAEARRNPGVRGAVIYRATAERDGTPAVVLAFGPPPGSEAITVEVRAQSDCRLLIQGAIL
ncbi:MAG: hypothetical protein ACR2HV_02355 [Acidimicrobiales bacterium]